MSAGRHAFGPALAVAAVLTAAPADAQFYWPWESPPRPAPQIIIQRPQRYAPPAAREAPRPLRPGAGRADVAKPRKPAAEQKPAEQKPAEEAAAPAPEGPPPPYEPQMLRLSELLGALAFLHPLCGGEPEAEWRGRMTSLINAEAPTPQRRERLAGAYNRGFKAYSVTYRRCTPAAEVIISRSLTEGGRLTRELTSRFGG